jgi:hypothetical protein
MLKSTSQSTWPSQSKGNRTKAKKRTRALSDQQKQQLLGKTQSVEEALEQQRRKAALVEQQFEQLSENVVQIPGFKFDKYKDRYFPQHVSSVPRTAAANTPMENCGSSSSSSSSSSSMKSCEINVIRMITQMTLRPQATTFRSFSPFVAMRQQFAPIGRKFTDEATRPRCFDVHPHHGLLTTSYKGIQYESEPIWFENQKYRLCQWSPSTERFLWAAVLENSILTIGDKRGLLKRTHIGRKMERFNKKNYIRCIQWTDDGNKILIGSEFGLFSQDCESESCTHLWNLTGTPVTAVFAQSQTLFYCALRNGGISVIDSRQQSAVKIASMVRCVDSLYMMQNGATLISQDGNGLVQLFDVRKIPFCKKMPPSCLHHFEDSGRRPFKARRFSVSFDESLLVTCSHDTLGVSMWDLKTLNLIRNINFAGNGADSACSSRNGYVEFPMTIKFDSIYHRTCAPLLLLHLETTSAGQNEGSTYDLFFRQFCC